MSRSAVKHPPPLALYIHFPWCVKKCPYCDFNSHALRDELPETQYLEALERDLACQCAEVAGRQVLSVFLGGGTPSLFSAEAIARVLAAARRHLDIACDAEVTLEANPGTVERGRFAEYRAAGINRVSLGAQSFDPGQLQALGRIHSVAETERAAAELHAAGLANFNIDLMYALPGQDVGGALRDIDAALALAPAHLSHYQLTIEAGTVFAAQPPAVPSDERAAQILEGLPAAPNGGELCAVRSIRVRHGGPPMSAQSQLLEIWRLPGYWRRRTWQTHPARRGGNCAHGAMARTAALHDGRAARAHAQPRCGLRFAV